MKNCAIKILLVEDNPGDARLIQEMMKETESFSAEVFRVDRLRTALQRLEKRDIDAVLLDLGLPDGVGIGNCTQIQKSFPNIPVIILTGTFQEEKLALACLRSGAQDYLTKNDVSAKELTRAITYALERKRLDQAKDDFVSMVTHELRNPLTVIKAVIDSLRKGIAGPLQPKQNEMIATVSRNVDHMTHWARNVLDIAKLTSGQAPIQQQPLNLKTIIHEAVENIQVKDAGKKIIWEEKISGPAAAKGDPEMIHEILTNLLTNAGRFAKKKVMIQMQETGEGVQVSVVDDGPGIPEKNLGDIFNKFVQIQQTKIQKDYKGTGLGLAICKVIAELHGGKIWAESPPGQGAQFHFTLPKA